MISNTFKLGLVGLCVLVWHIYQRLTPDTIYVGSVVKEVINNYRNMDMLTNELQSQITSLNNRRRNVFLSAKELFCDVTYQQFVKELRLYCKSDAMFQLYVSVIRVIEPSFLAMNHINHRNSNVVRWSRWYLING